MHHVRGAGVMADESATTATAEPATGTGAPGATPSSPAPPPEPSPAAPDWRQQIPEAIRGDKLWQRHKDAASVFQSYAEAQKTIGGMVKIPAADAKPEELAAFREKLGVPKDVSGYTPPDGVTVDDPERWAKWTAHAHRLGLTPAQLNGLAALEAEERGQGGAVTQQRYDAGHQELIQRWGQSLYDRNVTLASRAFLRFAPKELVAHVEETGLGDDPLMLQAWVNVGQLLGEHNFIDGRVVGVPGPDEAKRQIAAIRAQGRSHAANNPEMPGHRAAADALAELYKLAFGTADTAA